MRLSRAPEHVGLDSDAAGVLPGTCPTRLENKEIIERGRLNSKKQLFAVNGCGTGAQAKYELRLKEQGTRSQIKPENRGGVFDSVNWSIWKNDKKNITLEIKQSENNSKNKVLKSDFKKYTPSRKNAQNIIQLEIDLKRNVEPQLSPTLTKVPSREPILTNSTNLIVNRIPLIEPGAPGSGRKGSLDTNTILQKSQMEHFSTSLLRKRIN